MGEVFVEILTSGVKRKIRFVVLARWQHVFSAEVSDRSYAIASFFNTCKLHHKASLLLSATSLLCVEALHTRQRYKYKKFEIMLTRRAKAYSSSGSVL